MGSTTCVQWRIQGVRTRDGFNYLCTMENTGGEDQGWVQLLVYNGEYRG